MGFEGEVWRCPKCGDEPRRINGHWVFAPSLAEGNDGFRPEYFDDLSKLEVGNFWFEARNRLIVWGLRRYFPRAKRFLEIGCGTGFVLSEVRHRFPDLSLSGSEVFSSGLALAEKRVPDVELFQMDARRIPFQDEFDVIGAFDVLEHIDDDEAVISQMWRAARRGGGVLITVPQHPFLWSRADDYAFHKRRYTRREIAARIEGAGLSIVRIASFVSLLFPLMLVSRMKQRTATTVYDPSAEMRVGGLVNALLGLILRIEGVLIKQGLSFPAGGSLLVAAVKK